MVYLAMYKGKGNWVDKIIRFSQVSLIAIVRFLLIPQKLDVFLMKNLSELLDSCRASRHIPQALVMEVYGKK